ncbi:hypothetical protein IC762_05550 [Bradyrhizobium genosp. L]|uniref:phosphoribosyltransferase-like protein n=1 Tax=Bradyrhizobium genosp. L TaxID=83637 RepID=UPI0018A2790B|nr:hypothetical protein [Bradyrhizobium genosp. L]QPF85772.1 hypothetical protein IC762_05550 [Bradyrhizobium genosp. L]
MVTVAEAALHFYQRLSEQLLQEPALATQGVLMLCDKDWALPDQDIRGVAKALVRRIHPSAIEPGFLLGWKELGGPSRDGLVLDVRSDTHAPPERDARRAIEAAGPGVVLISNDRLTGIGLLILPFQRNEAVYDAVPLALKSLEEFCGGRLDVVASRRFMRGGVLAAFEVGLFPPAQRQIAAAFDEDQVLSLCRTLCGTWVYRGRQVTPEHAAKWAEQFRGARLIGEAMDVLKYLNSDGFLTRNYIVDCIREQYQSVLRKYETVQAISVQRIQKSEHHLVYDLRFLPREIVSFAEAIEIHKRDVTLVCFDDVVGSGGTFIDALFGGLAGVPVERVSEWLLDGNNQIVVVCAIAGEEGKRRVEEHEHAHGRVEIFAHRTIRNGEATFHERSRIFSKNSSGEKFMEFCRKVGDDLYPKAPLGYGDSRWCIATEYNAPNNSLPVIFARGNATRKWTPLFERIEPT